MRVPDFTGRVAAIAALTIGIASFYLLDGVPAQWQGVGSKLALAGGAIVVGLLKVYQSSMRDRDEIPTEQLSSSARAKKDTLRALNIIFIVAAGICLIIYVVSANMRQSVLHLPVFVWAACAVACALLREIVSGLRASSEFIR